MREVCFLLVQDKILRAYFGSATSIPDERERWETIWMHRDELTEIVHSHPGSFLGFSHEDLTTMEAVEAGTGKAFMWSIVTRSGFLSRKSGSDTLRQDSPWWLALLRQLSVRHAGLSSHDQENTTENNQKEKGANHMNVLINITYQGQSGNYLVNMDPGVDDATIKNVCEEAVRSGEVPGISPALPRNAFANFVIDRFRGDQPRFVVRPKVPFGT